MSDTIKDQREIYSINDFLNVLQPTLSNQLGLGDVVIEAISKEVGRQFRYVNWDRFKDANCPGCVSGPNECDIAYGRGEYHGVWAKIVNGKVQACPRRVNGTLMYSKGDIKEVDISEHKFNVVEPLDPISETP